MQRGTSKFLSYPNCNMVRYVSTCVLGSWNDRGMNFAGEEPKSEAVYAMYF